MENRHCGLKTREKVPVLHSWVVLKAHSIALMLSCTCKPHMCKSDTQASCPEPGMHTTVGHHLVWKQNLQSTCSDVVFLSRAAEEGQKRRGKGTLETSRAWLAFCEGEPRPSQNIPTFPSFSLGRAAQTERMVLVALSTSAKHGALELRCCCCAYSRAPAFSRCRIYAACSSYSRSQPNFCVALGGATAFAFAAFAALCMAFYLWLMKIIRSFSSKVILAGVVPPRPLPRKLCQSSQSNHSPVKALQNEPRPRRRSNCRRSFRPACGTHFFPLV